MRIRRKSRADPLRLPLVDPLPESIRQLPPRRDLLAHTLRIRLTEGTRVPVTPDGHDRVDVVDLEAVDLGDVGQLLIGRFSDRDDVDPFDLDMRARIGAGTQRLSVELLDQGCCDGPTVESDDLPRLELERV